LQGKEHQLPTKKREGRSGFGARKRGRMVGDGVVREENALPQTPCSSSHINYAVNFFDFIIKCVFIMP